MHCSRESILFIVCLLLVQALVWISGAYQGTTRMLIAVRRYVAAFRASCVLEQQPIAAYLPAELLLPALGQHELLAFVVRRKRPDGPAPQNLCAFPMFGGFKSLLFLRENSDEITPIGRFVLLHEIGHITPYSRYQHHEKPIHRVGWGVGLLLLCVAFSAGWGDHSLWWRGLLVGGCWLLVGGIQEFDLRENAALLRSECSADRYASGAFWTHYREDFDRARRLYLKLVEVQGGSWPADFRRRRTSFLKEVFARLLVGIHPHHGPPAPATIRYSVMALGSLAACATGVAMPALSAPVLFACGVLILALLILTRTASRRFVREGKAAIADIEAWKSESRGPTCTEVTAVCRAEANP